MRTAVSRLASLVAGDVARLVREVRVARNPPATQDIDGITIGLGPWATPHARFAIHTGVYESLERRVIEATLQADDVVLELGSGCGYITTVAAGIARDVQSFEANPNLVEVARSTLSRNGRSATVTNAVLARHPDAATVPFHLAPEFWESSLLPIPDSTVVDVPLRDLEQAIAGCTYLIVDIEGGEVELLAGTLADVRAICVETHPAVVEPPQMTAMLSALFAQGFELDLANSREVVLYLSRD
jgi:FkbM family methyltransferase